MARRTKIIADTSSILALVDINDRYHIPATRARANAELLIPATILPEVDYLATKYYGERVAKTFLKDVIAGSFTYLNVDASDIERSLEIMKTYTEFILGLVDASLVALAECYQIRNLLTLDRQHFNAIRPRGLDYFVLYPDSN